MQEAEQPQRKRRRLARDGEGYSDWRQTASEPKDAGFRGEQSAPFAQGGSHYDGHYTLGPGASLHQGNRVIIYQDRDIASHGGSRRHRDEPSVLAPRLTKGRERQGAH